MTDTDNPIRSEADQQLYHALAFAELPGVPSTANQIKPAIAAGADLNGILVDGCTPLTYAIQSGMSSPKAVKILLELGADPSQRDANGWTPWALCLDKMETTCVADRMRKIADLLNQFGADRVDEPILKMKQAVLQRDHELLQQLFADGVDINNQMISPLHLAVIEQDAGMVRFLLQQGANPEGNDLRHTPLMSAVQHNQIEIIKILLNAGSDPTRFDDDAAHGISPIILAKMNDHKDLAKWLERLFPDMEGVSRAKKRKINPKLRPVLKTGTNGSNFDLDNEDIIQQLDRWDALYGIKVSDVGADRVTVQFLSLPESIDALAREIYQFCPDVIDQGFGCFEDMFAMQNRDAQKVAPELAHLIDGVDLQHPDAGLLLLQRSLRNTHCIALWWD